MSQCKAVDCEIYSSSDVKDFNISIPPDYPWDVIVDDGGKNVVGELPQVVDINMGFQIIPQQVPDSYGKHFGKVGTNDTIGESGLSWLPDMHDHTKNLLNEFKSKHDTYVSDKGLNLVGDVENENTSNEEINQGEANEPLDPDVQEDVNLNTASNLPPQELQQQEELSSIESTDTSQFDQADTENQGISTTDDINLPNNYEIPDTVEVNTLSLPLGTQEYV